MPCATRARIKLLLFLILALLLISEATNADIYETVINPKATEFGNRVCTNKACTQQAARFLLHRDETANPCDDFVTYTCGNAKFYNKYDAMVQMNRITGRMNLKLLKEPISPNEKSYVTLTKLLFQKCIDKPALKASRKSGIPPLLDEIGGWPLLKSQWTAFTSSWEEYIATIHRKYKKPLLFQIESAASVAANRPVTKSLVLKPVADDVLSKAFKNLALELGASNPATLDAEITKFMTNIEGKREQILASITQPPKKERDTLDKLKSKFTNFNIQKYIDVLYNGIPFPQNMKITVQNVEYFEKLSTLFADKRVFANYAGAIIAEHISKLDENTESDPEIACYMVVTSLAVVPLTHMFTERHFNRGDYEPEINKMLKALSDELKTVITEASWLDDATRATALKKLANVIYEIGYPDFAFDDAYVLEKHSVPFNPSDSFYTLAAHLGEKIYATTVLSQLGRPQERTHWDKEPYIANAFYTLLTNKIALCSGILQPPFYNRNVPNYLNYATIVHVIGHEFMHGFDSEGAMYDQDAIPRPWWAPETLQKYKDKAQCFVDQVNTEGFDGGLTLTENIADNEGLKLAYRVYKKLVASLPEPEPALPGFEEFTVDQMFFITLANGWCEPVPQNIDPNDPHLTNSARVKVMVQNMEEFSKAFNCPKQARMNSDNRCAIW